jgi:predicted ATPase/GAF domain-containing protein
MLTIPGYQLEGQITETLLTRVYRARRERDSLDVLVKFLRSENPTTGEIARFRQEYELFQSLNIPGIVSALEWGHHQHTYAMVLSTAAGESVAGLIRQTSLPIAEWLSLAEQMVTLVGRLHAAQIIHKDLQPAHFLWDAATRQVILLDLSIATRLSQEKLTLKNPEVIEGTLAYISPEQTGRMNRAIDYRTDFYSLGVCFYQMLTRRLPFEAQDALDLVYSHIARRPLSPEQINPRIPSVLVDMVLKLLEKNAEDRYQSAAGLQADLQHCARLWAETGQIKSFALAQEDVSTAFQLPQKLYGREDEVRTLLKEFERAAAGGSAALLISGYSGIGKTTLVHEIHRPITARRGAFIEGKFDLLQRNIPYSGWITAFTLLVNDLLMESDASLVEWKQRIQAALGNNGSLLTDVVPDLQLILGAQPALPALPPVEAQNRFQRAFQDFVKVFASAEHPLAVFLDDLQWADQASLSLMESLLNDPELAHFFFVGAYRENEVDAAHPLMRLAEKMAQAGRYLPVLNLHPLRGEHIQQLLEDMFHCPAGRAADLAQLVAAKTDGNPFFIGEFLKMLHESGLVVYDRGWQWDLERIRQAHIHDSVVDFMLRKVELLPPATLQVLKVASCIGAKFDLGLLEQIPMRGEVRALPALQVAFQTGLVVREETTVHFIHDKVNEVVYELITADERELYHHQIGQAMLATTQGALAEKLVFNIAEQFNAAQARLSEAEKQILFQANLQAGRRARASAAFDSSARFLRKAASLLPHDAWEADYPATLALYCDWAEAEYVATNYLVVEELINQVLGHAQGLPDKIRVYRLLCNYYQTSMRFKDIVAVVLAVMADIGLPFCAPESIDSAATQAQLERFTRQLSEHPMETLTFLPEAASPYKEAIELLAETHTVFMLAYPNASLYAVLEAVNLTLEHGVCSASARSMSMLGFLLCAITGQVELGYGVGQTALNLIDRFEDTFNLPNVWLHFYNFIAYWRHPTSYGSDQLLQAYQVAVSVGNNLFAAYNLNNYLGRGLFYGQYLPENRERYNQFAASFFRLKQPNTYGTFNALRQTISNLLGLAADPCQLEGEYINLATELPKFQAMKFYGEIGVLSFAQLYVQCFMGDFSGALQYLATPGIIEGLNALRGLYLVYLARFFSALTYLQNYDTATEANQVEYLEKAQVVLTQLQTCAAESPANFTHLYALVSAEMARVKGDPWAATEFYHQAISAAHEQEFTHIEALANELAAKFWQARGMDVYTQARFRAAYAAYQSWGAQAKVAQLRHQYPWLEPEQDESAPTLDVATIAKAARAISSEIELEKSVERLMQMVNENAGAERGVLLLKQGDNLVVQAEIGGWIAHPVELEERSDLPLTLIHYVQHTGKSILLDHTSAATDPYLVRRRPQSVLCLPILRQMELMGILYLENNLATHVFHPRHLIVLEILCAQAAISLENARYYAEISRLNNELEQRVIARTAQLEAANKEMEAFSYSVSHDLRAPLRAIGGYARILAQDYEAVLDSEGQRLCNVIGDKTQQMNHLIEAMLALSRTGRAEMRLVKLDMRALAEMAFQELTTPETRQQVSFQLADLPSIKGDPALFHQVWINLIQNALKFSAQAKSPAVRVDYTVTEKEIVFCVSDNGVGFDMQYANKLFAVFQRLHTEREFEGTGVGLAIVQRIIHRHGGRVWAEGRLNQGAAFYFALPKSP